MQAVRGGGIIDHRIDHHRAALFVRYSAGPRGGHWQCHGIAPTPAADRAQPPSRAVGSPRAVPQQGAHR